MSQKSCCRVVFTVLCLAFTLSATAQGPAEPPGPALLADAEAYAQSFGVTVEEAVQRLRLQDEAGLLGAALQEEDPQGFAGLWIEHRPDFRVIAAFRNPNAARPRVEARVRGTGLAGLVELRRGELSLARLEELFEITRRRVRQVGFDADLAVDVRANRVKVFTVDAPGLRKALGAARVELPANVDVEQVEALSEPVSTLIGGQPASGCTWAFTVQHPNGDVGILTAAHCGNSQSYAGVSLPFRLEDQQGNQDVQWHSACDLFDVSNQFESGIGLRSCIGTRSRDQQAIGSLVWKYGSTTGRTWSHIEYKTFAPWWVTSAASTFIYTDGDPYPFDFSEPGDSGSPVFVEDLAYGVLIGHNTTNKDGIYMAINYISSLGVSVLTFDPPANCTICGDGVCESGETCSQDCTTCGDGICSPGEVCSLDCTQGFCGDGICEFGEVCSLDCGGYCGDGICQVGEEWCSDCQYCGSFRCVQPF